MIQGLIYSLVISLCLTLALESGFFLLLRIVFRRFGYGQDKNNRLLCRDLLLVILVNIVTNPVVVLLYWLTMVYTNWNIVIVVIALELFAVLFEGCYYKNYGMAFKKPYLFSAAANMFSFWTGMLIQFLI